VSATEQGKASTPVPLQKEECSGFREHRNGKRFKSPDEELGTKSNKTGTTPGAEKSTGESSRQPAAAPLRSAEMEVDIEDSNDKQPTKEQHEQATSRNGSNHPQNEQNGSFQFRSIQNGARDVAKEMAGFSVITSLLHFSPYV
jgi:hypothetical protein